MMKRTDIIKSIESSGLTLRMVMQELLSIVWVLLLLFTLFGCTEADIVNGVEKDIQPMTLHFSSPGLGSVDNQLRADTKDASEPLPTGVTVRIAAYYRKAIDEQVDFTTTAPTYQATYEVKEDGSLAPCMVDADGKKTDGTASGLAVRGGTYDFYAVSPARPLQQPASVPYDNYHIAGILHKEDVMTSYARNVAVSATSNNVALNTFIRKCALVIFNVAPSNDNALPFDRLYGTSLTLKKVSASGASLTAGEDTGISPTGGSEGAASEVAFTSTDFEQVGGENPAGLNKAKGVVLPKNKEPFDVSLTVVRDDETATLNATIDKQITFDPGKRYIFTLEVKNNTSRLLMSVLNWTAIPFTDSDVGGSDPDRPTDPEITPLPSTTITVAEWDEIPWTGNGLAGNSATIRLDNSVLMNYIASIKANVTNTNLNDFPPFDIDYDGGKWIKDNHQGVDFTINGDNSTMTGYYLLQVESGQSGSNYKYQSGSTYPARKYCEDLREGGFSDWRLPTQIELYAMWDKAKGTDRDASDDEADSSIYGKPFLSSTYWSSSVYGNIGLRCVILFGSGVLAGQYNDISNYKVRCVRDKTIQLTYNSSILTINQEMLRKYAAKAENLSNYPPFDINGDGDQSIKDKHSDVDFTIDGANSTMTGYYQIQVESTQRPDYANYATMHNYCNNLSVDGHSDWRLPTQIELYAMWDKAKETNNNAGDGEVDSSRFGVPFKIDRYWSSSVYDRISSKRCGLHFGSGNFGDYNTSGLNYVRCVRDLN